jgi:hypothetical protein
MIFHVGHELPVKEERQLDCVAPSFTSEETRIIKRQIRRNMAVIDAHIRKIDLFVNHEHHPSRAAYVEALHGRLSLLMEENDTFRNVLWNQTRKENLGAPFL